MRGRKSAAAASGTSTFPGYASVGELASGAFATVYRAVELGTGRAVALKVLRVADTSPHLVDVFEKELGALALLSNHPNVTTLYGTFFTPDGRPVLVLELCRESLAHRVRQSGPLSAGEVVQVGIKIAGALETAHRSGLLHRDMKPQNILVSQFDEPVLADFGVATLQAQAQSTEGVFGFTTLHAPPEALEGLPLSPSADIYGLASSMYQLLVGRGPFSSYEGEAPASVILRILRDPAPRAPATGVPVALADLMESALAKDPGKRPQTAGHFADSLREIEALAGWPQTPYVVWGTSSVAPPDEGSLEPAEQGPVPSPIGITAARLSDLLRADGHGGQPAPLPLVPPAPPPPPFANILQPSPAPVTVAQPSPAPVTALSSPSRPAEPPSPPSVLAPSLVAAPALVPAPPAMPAAALAAAVPGPAPATAPQPLLARTSVEPTVPGTRTVVAPQQQERKVLAPVAPRAHVRAFTLPRSSSPGPWAQGLAPAGPSQTGATWPQNSSPRPMGQAAHAMFRGLSPRQPAVEAAPPTAHKARTVVLAFAAAVVVAGGAVAAALAHLL